MAKDNYSSSSSLAFYDQVPFWIKPRPKEVRRQLPKEVRRQLLESQTCLRFWQQPAGFEDSVICKWKVLEQGSRYPVSISVKDMFTGGLAESTRCTQRLVQQIPAWVFGK